MHYIMLQLYRDDDAKMVVYLNRRYRLNDGRNHALVLCTYLGTHLCLPK